MKRNQEAIQIAFDTRWFEALMTLPSGAAIKIALEIGRHEAEQEFATLSSLYDTLQFDTRTSEKHVQILTSRGLVQKVHKTLMTGLEYSRPYCVYEGRQFIPTAVRREVFERDNHACQYCGSTERLSLDHVVPWSRGGKDSVQNLVTACRSCNSKKNARTPEEWLGNGN